MQLEAGMTGKTWDCITVKACKQVEEDLHDLERESHWLAPPGLCLMESGLRLLVLAACCEPRGRTKEHAERINLDVFIIVAFYCCWWGRLFCGTLCTLRLWALEVSSVRRAGNSRVSPAQTSWPQCWRYEDVIVTQ
jgi:hypothetical protein